MSYDVAIGSESFNMTSNIGKLFYDHIPGWNLAEGEIDENENHRGGLHAIHGKTGREAAEILSNALYKIERTRCKYWSHDTVGDPEFCALYDSENGWGSAVGALIFLSQIMAACYRHPKKRVSLCA